jgi:hypothetical protein
MRTFGFVALTLALTVVVAGCASTSTVDTSWPSASPSSEPEPAVLTSPNTNAPLAGHSDAAGSASVPGYYSVPAAVIVTPDAVVVTPEKR